MKVLLIDDQPLIRLGLSRLIKSFNNFKVCGEAHDTSSAQKLMTELLPDLTILDLLMGGRGGMELVKELKTLHPAGRILVYTSHDENIYARRVLQAGAHGYVMKRLEIKQLRQAIEAVTRGEHYVSDVLQKAFIKEMFEGSRKRDKASQPKLSDRELQILYILGMGMSSAQIAKDLSLSIKTIGTYRERIKDKLNLATAAELENYAQDFVHAATHDKRAA